MVAAINAATEKHLKEILGVTPKYFDWLYMEDSFDVIQYRGKRYAINQSIIVIYSLYFGQVDFNFGQVEN